MDGKEEKGDSGEEWSDGSPSMNEEESVVSDEGSGRGPLSRFVGHRSTKARNSKGRYEKVELRAYDVYMMVFHDRPGSYYCITSRYFQRRAYTAEEITERLRQYYGMLVARRGRVRAFEGDMTAEELQSWWCVDDTVREGMSQFYAPSSSRSSSSSSRPPLTYDLGYKAFLTSFYRPWETRRRGHSPIEFFSCLATYVPLLLSSYFRLQQSVALTALLSSSSSSSTSESDHIMAQPLLLGVVALKQITPNETSSEREVQAIQGGLCAISREEYEALCEAGADHSILEAKYAERSDLRKRKRKKVVDDRQARIDARSRPRPQEVQQQVQPTRRSTRRVVVVARPPPLTSSLQPGDQSPSPSLEPGAPDTVRRPRGRPRKDKEEVEFYVVVGGMSMVNEACALHCDSSSHDQWPSPPPARMHGRPWQRAPHNHSQPPTAIQALQGQAPCAV